MMISPAMTDCSFMEIALEEARKAAIEGEVPIGAVLVFEGRMFRDHNRMIQSSDPTAHAEIMVMRQASNAVGNYRLTGSSLYVTVEPCLMCAGAIVHARIGRLVYAARDERYGAVESLIRSFELGLNHRPVIECGPLGNECSELIREFFREKRQGEVPKRL